MSTVKQSKKSVMRLIFVNCYEHNVAKNAAALAYHLLFALFPLLIFISNLVGLLNLNVYAVTNALQQVLPDDIVSIIESYLDHISHTSSHTLLWFSLVFSIWFPMRAAQGLMDDVRRAYGLGTPQKPLLYMVRQLIYTVVFLVVIVLTLFLSIMGKQVITSVLELLPTDAIEVSDFVLLLWQYLRFLPIALLMVAAIGTLYAVSLDTRPKIKTIMPGIAAALVLWLILSVGFSFYVENFSHYSLIYGTLGTVIILMIWLYLTAFTLILGAELNAALMTASNQR